MSRRRKIPRLLEGLIDSCHRCAAVDKPFLLYEAYRRWLPKEMRTLVIGESPPPSHKESFFYNLGAFDRLRLSTRFVFGWELDNGGLLEAVKGSGIFFTASVKCRPPSRKELPVMRRNCLYVLREELELLKPKMVVAMGRYALTSIAEIYGLREGEVGEPRKIRVNGLNLMVTPHFNYVFRFRRDLAPKIRELLGFRMSPR